MEQKILFTRKLTTVFCNKCIYTVAFNHSTWKIRPRNFDRPRFIRVKLKELYWVLNVFIITPNSGFFVPYGKIYDTVPTARGLSIKQSLRTYYKNIFIEVTYVI